VQPIEIVAVDHRRDVGAYALRHIVHPHLHRLRAAELRPGTSRSRAAEKARIKPSWSCAVRHSARGRNMMNVSLCSTHRVGGNFGAGTQGNGGLHLGQAQQRFFDPRLRLHRGGQGNTGLGCRDSKGAFVKTRNELGP
jgi:hypothetical protein